MKNKGRSSPPMISSLIFVIQPLRVAFYQPQSDAYSLQFDRGEQTIKKYAQSLTFPKDELGYQFPIQKTEMIKLKLQSEHDLDFQWELYRLKGKMSTFSQCIPVNLMEFYRIYVHSIIKSGIDFERMKEDMRKGQFQARRWEIDRESLQWEFTENIGKSVGKEVQIAYRLQIWNEFDIFAQNRSQKIHQVSPGGTSLKNSSQQSQQDEFPQNLPFDPCKSPKYGKQSPKGTIKRNYFQPISMLKRNSALSEIIQCSNENSSIINYGQRYVQLEEIQGIPEEQNDQSPYTQSGETFRRTNTLDSELYQFPPARLSRKKLSTPQRKLSEDGEKDSFGRMETGLQSLVQGKINQNKPLSQKMSPKLMIVLVICLLAIGYLVYSKIDPNKSIKKLRKNPSKKVQTSQTPPKLPKKQKEVRKK